MDTKQYAKEDIIINFKDMLLYILLRWRSILAGVLILTVLAGGYKYWQDYRQYQAKLAAAEQELQVGADLSEEALANAGIVLNYQKLYEAQAKYNADAPLMQIDPNAVPTLTFSGVVSGDKGYAAAVLYQNLLNDNATYTAIAEELNWDNASYVADLVDLELVYRNGANLSGDADYALIRVRIKALTEDQCRTMEKILRTRMAALKANVTQAAGQHSITLSSTNFALLVDAGLKSAQQGHINNCNTLRTNLENATDKLSDEEKAYIEEFNAEAQAPTDEKPVINPPSISKKYLVLGFGGGVVLFVLLYGLTYVFDKRIKSKEDLTLRYGLSLFGSIAVGGCKKRRCFIDRWLLRLFAGADGTVPPEQAAHLLQQQVLLTAQKTGAKALYVTGCALTQQSEETLQELKKALETAGISLQTGAYPLYDADSLQRMAAADALLLAETVGVSTYQAIYRELALAKQLEIPVLGAIVLQK